MLTFTSRRTYWLVCVPLFLAVFGTKLAVIHHYGSDLPYWDQWPGEGVNTFLPWLERGEFWQPLLTPHNEHRIAPTRLLSLALLMLSGQWDARLQCVVNAALHAGMIVAGLGWLRRRMAPTEWCVSVLCCAFLYALPIAWENVLAGFQSQYYFLIALSLFGVGGCLTFRALSPRWLVAAGACFVAVVTMGSGLLVAFPLAVIALLRFIQRVERRDACLNLALAAAVGVLGAYLYSPAEHHASIHAKSIGQFCAYVARCLSWPWPHWPWLCVVVWSPWLLLCYRRLASRDLAQEKTCDVLIAFGLWVLAQTAALGYSRGASGLLPSARYGEVTGLGVVLCLAVLGIYGRLIGPKAARRCFTAGFVGLVVVAGFLAVRSVVMHDLPKARGEFRRYEANVRSFILTDQEAYLKEGEIPFPWMSWLRDLLRNPTIRSILPASVRAPIPLAGFSTTMVDAQPRRVRVLSPGETWTSAALRAGWARWRIEWLDQTSVAAAEGSVVVRSVQDQRPFAAALTPSAPGDATHWRAATFPVAGKRCLVEATASASGGLLLTEPVEISVFSDYAARLCAAGTFVAIAGAAGLTCVGGWLVVRRRRAESFMGEPLVSRS